MKRLLFALIVAVALLAVVDRIAAVAAEHQVASRIQQEQGLVDSPDVTIGGFPFLTQAIAGHYDDVTLVLRDLRRGPVPVARLTAHLSGVRVPLTDVVGGHVGHVPVDRANAQVLVTYAGLDAWLGSRHLRVGPGPAGEVKVTVSGTVAGQRVGASAVGRLTVTTDAVEVVTGSGLQIRIPLPGLPFRIRLLRAESTRDGLLVDASAEGLVLRTAAG